MVERAALDVARWDKLVSRFLQCLSVAMPRYVRFQG